MNYGQLLRRAWEITWRWKALWILGFLSALGGMGGGSNYRYSWRGDMVMPGGVLATVLIGCLGLLVVAVVFVVSTIAGGGLIGGVQQVEESGGTSFSPAWRVGVRRFWPLLAVRLLMLLAGFVAIFVPTLLVGLAFGLSFTSARGMDGFGRAAPLLLCLLPLGCVAILIVLALLFLLAFADRAIVLENHGAIDGISRGWEVLRANLGRAIVLALIVAVIFLAISIVAGAIAALLFLPFRGLFRGTADGARTALLACSGLLGLVIWALVAAIAQTFTSSTWTLAYREFTGVRTTAVATYPAPPAPPEQPVPPVTPEPGPPAEPPTPPPEPPVAEPPVS